jgi:hypothetical protein
MRTFALCIAVALSAFMLSLSPVWAWSSETTVTQGKNGANIADPLTSEETLKALQDKVNGGTEGKTNFFISGGTPEQSIGRFGMQPNIPGQAPIFGYSPNPGFRGN